MPYPGLGIEGWKQKSIINELLTRRYQLKTDTFDVDKNQSSRVRSRLSTDLTRLTTEVEQVKPEIDPQVTELLAHIEEKTEKRRLPKKSK